ncbi:hypothetical protein CCHL11_06671 [Colletotrichum chlorophyti]|uniref:Mtf2-like C-terminal domain-containing protein n=1 Tax=Colletotrichum chlorophyti TaxID=708187 RepID=A0A1Q8RXP7_9PEZI|nr:hypothetical protein CCHL11_06671 [Colletotrichum chlorophyti]
MPTSLTPFLYQTRTILRASVALRSLSTTASHHQHHPRRTRGEQSIPFEWDGPAEERADIPSGPDASEKSTITPTERHIFRNIFTDIAKRGQSPGQAPPSGLPQDARASLETSELGSRDAILSKYPPALRRAAEVALGMRDAQGDTPPSMSPISFKPEEDIEASEQEAARLTKIAEQEAARERFRTQEVARLQALLDQCNTDVEVWNVLENEVFSMVEKLGIAVEKPQTDKNGGKKGKAENVLDMDSYGPLYSLHLLQGLKTLDQAFTRPSPLALSILPRIKELGLASYVLGVSTPLYNELASIFWYRHGDTNAVLAVLDDMQFAGLFYDHETLRLVDTIELALDSFRNGELGVFSKTMVTMPAYNLDVKSTFARYARRVRHGIRAESGSAKY